jgi:PEGA domain
MRNIVIDLGNLEYLYSDTINAFIASNRHMLEVSGRIAILTEHPKVQDILKRAGLDNIMRIYRSEAEMIADAKEILRQTSSYRIDELQKAAATSSQSTIQIPPQIVTPAPIPKGEFEDFRFEMGQQLETKLDNNEVPQYQYGGNTAAKPATPSTPPTPPPYVPPVVQPPVGYGQQSTPQAGYGTGYSTPPTPQYGQNENANPQGFAAYPSSSGYQQGGPGAPAAFTPEPRQDENAPYDFPTVQLPVGSYSQPTQPPANTTENGDAGEDLGQRGRLGAEDRLRSPNARKGTGRRVGGREGDEQPQAADATYPAYSTSIPSDSTLSPAPTEPDSSHFGPISKPSSLIEEKASSSKLFVFAALFIIFIGGIWFFTSQGSPEEVQTEDTPPAPEQAQPQPVAPVDSSVVATPAPVDSAKAVQPPTETPPETVKPEPVKPEPKPTPIAKDPKPSRPKTPKVPKPEPEYVAPVKPDPSETPAASSGEIRVVSDPPGAEVLVNFSKKGVTPLTIALGNNTNRIIIRKDGYKRYETTLSKNSAEPELSVSLDPESGAPPKIAPPKIEEPEPIEPTEPKIEPKPEPVVTRPKPTPPRIEPPVEKTPPPDEEVFSPPPQPKPQAFEAGSGAPGIIFLSSSPARADIIVDGKDTGKKTPAKMELPSGPHRIEMSKSGQKASVEHVVNEGKNKALHLNLQ